jgi:hypothetical protein
MNQVGRNLTDAVDGLLNGKRYLIHDRDPLFTADFLSMLAEAGVASVCSCCVSYVPNDSDATQIDPARNLLACPRQNDRFFGHYALPSYLARKRRMYAYSRRMARGLRTCGMSERARILYPPRF